MTPLRVNVAPRWNPFFGASSAESSLVASTGLNRPYNPLATKSSSNSSKLKNSMNIVVSQTRKVSTIFSENESLAQLSPIQRWAYIARNHQFEFAMSLASLFAAVYIIVKSILTVIPNISGFLVSTAFAQGTSEATIPFDLRMGVGLIMALSLAWSYALASFAKAATKIALAKESISFFRGFSLGLLLECPDNAD
jgi:hypothetical protein